MNVQIFGAKKSFDTKKAERWFKERRIKYQYIDMAEKGLSKGELQSVASAVGGAEALLDDNARDQQTLALLRHTPKAMLLDKLLENQHVIRTPIVRNGRAATVGNAPEVWASWE